MRHFYRLMLTLTVVAMGSVTFLSETATAQCALSQFGSGTLEVGLSGAFTEGGATVPQVPTGIVITPNPGACQVAIQFTEPTADPANTCMPGTVNESGSGGSAPGVIYSLGLGQGTTYQLLVGGVPQGDANDTYNISIDVIDDILPTLTCPLDGTILPHTTAAANCSYDAPEFSTIAGSDVCSPIVTYTTTWTGVAPTMGSGSITGRDLPSLNKGSYTIEVSVSDGAGNTTDFSSCSFTLNITDETPATHTCPVDVTVELQRGALPIVTQGTPGAGEQAWATTTATGANAFPAVNEFFVLDDALDNCGVTAMKWRAAVISDNCPEYTVTINSDIAASNTANNRTGIFNAVTVAPLSSATNQAIPATYSSSTEKSITVFARGRGNTPNLLGKNVYNESYLVTDCSGSTFECAFTVTVIDSGSITPAPSACAVTDTITVGTNGTVISGANVTTSASAPAAAGAMTVDGTTANDCGLVNVQYRSEVYQDNCAAYTIEIASELDPELGSYWALDEISGAGADQALAIGTNSVAVTTDLVTGVPSSFEIKYTGAAGTVAKGIYNESYKITDCGGFTTGCEFTVNVVDNERPVASACPSDLTIGTSGAAISTAVDGLTPVAGTAFCAAGVNVAFDIATDNCPEGSYTFETTGASTTPISTLSPTVTTGTPNTFEVSTADVALEKGTTTFTYTFYDCGSTNVAPAMATTPAVCTFNVTVIDDEDPISSLCPPSIVINTDGVNAGRIFIGPSIIGAAAVQTLGDCAAEVSWAAPQTLDNCPEGTYTVSVDFSDAAGAPDVDPTLAATAVTGVMNTAVSRYDFILGADNAGVTFQKGTTIITYTFIDCGSENAAPNTTAPAICSFAVTVVEDPGEVPVVATCPPNATVSTDPNGGILLTSGGTGITSVQKATGAGTNPNDCGAEVIWDEPTFSDNCPEATITLSIDGSLISTGIAPPTGTGTGDILVAPNGTGGNYFTLNGNDNYPPATATGNDGAFFDKATSPHTVTYEMTDCGGNIVTCTFTVTVADDQDPIVSAATCPTNITLGSDESAVFAAGVWTVSAGTNLTDCGAEINWADPIVTDNCPEGSYTIGTMYAPGCVMNSFADVTPALLLAGAVETNGSTTFTLPSPLDNVVYNTGTSTITYSFYDCGSTNVAPVPATAVAICSFTVTVTDMTAPSIACPVSSTVLTSAATPVAACAADFTWTAPTVTENCTALSIELTTTNASVPLVGTCFTDLAITEGVSSTTCPGFTAVPVDAALNAAFVTSSQFPKGVSTVSYSVVDAGGNTAACSFTVTVQDDEVSTNTCPANVVVGTGNSATWDGTAWDVTAAGTVLTDCAAEAGWADITALDNCPEGTYTFSTLPSLGIDVGATPITGTGTCPGPYTFVIPGVPTATFAKGVNTVTYTITDCSGLQSVCSFTITVNDNQPAAPTTCIASATIGTNGALIAGGAVGTFVFDATTGDCEAAGTITSPTYTDNCPGLTVNFTGADFMMSLNGDPAIAPGAAITSLNTADLTFTTIAGQLSKGAHTVTYDITDCSGAMITCEFAVTIVDNEAPAFISCPVSSSVATDPGVCTNANMWASPIASDNCPEGTVAFSIVHTGTCGLPMSLGAVGTDGAPAATSPAITTYTLSPAGVALLPNSAVLNKGMNLITYTLTDCGGLTTECAFTIEVKDLELPTTSTCPIDFSVATDATSFCGADVTFRLPVFVDNCDPTSIGGTMIIDGSRYGLTLDGAGNASGNFAYDATHEMWFTYVDACGNGTAECKFFITVGPDLLPPTAVCPPAPTVQLDAAGNGTLPANVGTALSTDNCPTITETTPSVVVDCTNLTNLGAVNTFVLTAEDQSGNTGTALCSFVVEDNIAPVAVCLAVEPVVVLDASGAGTLAALTGPSVGQATDNCSATTQSRTATVVSCINVLSSPGYVGASYVLTATDASGNVGTTMCGIDVLDQTPPTLVCPAMTINAPSCTATVTWATPVPTDACGVAIFNRTDSNPFASGATLSVGTYIIAYEAFDHAGNQTTCSFQISVTDPNPPVIVCPPSVTVSPNVSATDCQSQVTWATITATDDCTPTPLLSYVIVDGGVGATRTGGTFPVGVTTVTVTVSDAGGNTSTCSFVVDVKDIIPPSIAAFTCPTGVTWSAPGNACEAQVFYTLPVFSDECGLASIELTYESCDPTLGWSSVRNGGSPLPLPGSWFPAGFTNTTLISYVATDYYGNSTGCIFNVTVVEADAPSIVCPANITIGTGSTGLYPMVDPDSFIASLDNTIDNCDAIVTSALFAQAADPTTTPITYSDNCMFGGIPATCGVQPVDYRIDGAAWVLETYGLSGITFDKGTAAIDFRVTDNSGNTAMCSFTLTVVDDELPYISCPANITLNTGDDYVLTPAGVTVVAASDLTDCASMVTYSIDGNDNCPMSNITINAGTNGAGTDPFAIAAGDRTTSTSVYTGTYSKGTSYTESFTITDMQGNTAMCMFTVEVVDNQAPVVACPANSTVSTSGVLVAGGVTVGAETDYDCDVDVVYQVNVLDNCPEVVLTADPANTAVGTSPYSTGASTAGFALYGGVFAHEPVGVYTESFNVVDAAGNSASCSFTITVVDDELPMITCPAVPIVLQADPGVCVATLPVAVVPTTADNCTLPVNQLSWTLTNAITTVSINSGGYVPVDDLMGTMVEPGVYNGDYFLVDNSGNGPVQCIFQIVIIDRERPVMTCPSDVTIGTATLDLVAAGNSTVVSGRPGPGNPAGNQIEVPNTADLNYNTVGADQVLGDCAAVVTFDLPPVFENCTGAGTPAAVGYYTDYLIANSLPLGIYATDKKSGDTYDKGTSNITFYALDAAGNISVCDFTITVIDNEVPLITCPVSVTVSNDLGLCSAALTSLDPIATFENCIATDPAVLVNNYNATSSANDVYTAETTTTVVYTLTDAAGNAASCSFTVRVEDTEAPAITCPASITQDTDLNACTATVTTVDFLANSDNCAVAGVTNTFNGTATANGVYSLGTTPVTYTVTDVNGNTGECSFTVTIEDNQFPVISCPASVVLTTSGGVDMMTGDCAAMFTYATPAAMDNCSTGASLPVTQIDASGLTSGDLFPVGTTTQEWSASDASGNVTTCGFTITVNDDELPLLTCPASVTAIAGFNDCEREVFFNNPIVFENCGIIPAVQTLGDPSGYEFPVGVTTVAFTAVDAAGNVGNCMFTITVLDTQAPYLLGCPTSQTINNEPGLCTAAANYQVPTPSDNCPAFVLIGTATLPSGMNVSANPVYQYPVGTTSVVYIATDASGNTARCAFTITVNDNEAPVICCPADMTLNVAAGCGAAVAYTAPALGNAVCPRASDNCPGAVVALMTPGFGPGATFALGTTPVTYMITDATGKTADCTFNVTVRDTGVPTLVCPSNAVVSNDPAMCGANYSYTAPASVDPCSGATTSLTAGNAGASAFYPVGVTTNSYSSIDASGNVASCSFTVTVNDNELPTLACPAVVTLASDPGICGTFAVLTAPAGADNCPGAVVTRVSGSSSPFYSVGIMYPYVYKVTDAAGNMATCAFNVTSVDKIAPTILPCPASVVVNATTGACSATANWNVPTASDNCSGGLSVVASHNPGVSVFPAGNTVVTYTATDASGNTAVCAFTVTVNDNDLPTISCPASVTVNNDPALCSALITYSAVTGTDNCPAFVVALAAGLGSGSAFPVGVNTESYTVTDASGNVATCSFTVTVLDNESPVICPPAVPFTAGPAIPVGGLVVLDGGVINHTFTVSQNVAIADLSIAIAGNHTWIGDMIYSLIHPDGTRVDFWNPSAYLFGSSTSPNFNLVFDDQATQSAPTTANYNTGASFTPSAALAAFNGKSSAGTWTLRLEDTFLADGGAVTAFGLTITPSTFGNVIVAAPVGTCSALVTYVAPAAVDNCPGVSTGVAAGPASGTVLAIGTHPVTYTAQDAGGRIATCRFNVIVTDVEAPTLTCPANVTTNVVATVPSFQTFTNFTGTANSASAVAANILNSTTEIIAITEVKVAIFGTIGSTATVTVWSSPVPISGTRPVLSTTAGVPANWNSQAISGVVVQASTSAANATPLATVVLTNPILIAPGQAIGFAYSSTSSVAYLTVAAGVQNTISPSGLILQTGTGIGFGGTATSLANTPRGMIADFKTVFLTGPLSVGTIASLGTNIPVPSATAADRCTAVTLTNNAPAATVGCLGGQQTFPVGTTTITYTATDAGGNVTSCQTTVTVVDDVAPTIVCPASSTVNNTPGVCGSNLVYAVNATDNCNLAVTPTLVSGPASGSLFPAAATTTVVWSAGDASGNVSTCSFNVTVIDTEAPVVTCPANIAVNADATLCSQVVTFNAPSNTDNCPGAVVTSFTSAPLTGLGNGSQYPVGTTTMLYAATDGNANLGSCAFTVTVNDVTAPSIVCPSNIVVNGDAGSCSAVITYAAAAGADNCPGVVVAQTAGIGNGGTFAGTSTETFVATDASGNTAGCSFTVTVVDTEVPTITCPANIVGVVNEAGLCGATVAFAAAGASDNCPSVAVVASPVSGSFFNVGTTTVTYTAFDGSGNTAACTFTVNVVDTEVPTVLCPVPFSVNAGSGACALTVTYPAPTSSDNCAIVATTAVGIASGGSFPVGTSTVMYQVADAAGNAATCNFTVTVVDNVAPVLAASNMVVCNDLGSCNAVVNYLSTTGTSGIVITENCPGYNVVVTSGLASGSVFPLGTSTVSVMVTDASGNMATATINITVNDCEAPVINCVNRIIQLASPTSTQAIIPTDVYGGGTDNCGQVFPISVFPFGPFSCANLGDNPVVLTARDNAGNVSTCSAMVTVTGCTPLPVELLTFDGYNDGGVNNLYWITAAEYNSDYFVLEKSIDGIKFDKVIAMVPAQGNSANQSNYDAIDNEPVNGANYYRLKMVDLDGSYVYSDIVTINVSWSFDINNIIPNPTSGNADVLFTSDIDGRMLYNIYDMNGKLVRSAQVTASKGMNTLHLDISDLARGVYNFVLENGKTRVNQRVVKQ